MPTDSPLILGRAVPAAGPHRPDLDTRAEALFAQARKRHDDEIRADERRRVLADIEEKAVQAEAKAKKRGAAFSDRANWYRELAAELRGKP